MPRREGGQLVEDGQQPAQHQPKPIPQDHAVGVVGDETAGGAEVDESTRSRCLVAEMVHVRHDVMAEAPLVACSGIEVCVVQVGPHIGDGRVGDLDTQLLLGLCQRKP